MDGKAGQAAEQQALDIEHVLPLLDDAVLSESEQLLVRQHGKPLSLSPGEVIFKRGTHAGEMYVIEAGRVELDSGTDLLPRYLGPGEFFGELALLLRGHRHTVDARANTVVEMIQIDAPAFCQMLVMAPATVVGLLRRTLLRITVHEASLIRQLRRRDTELEAALENLDQTTHQLHHSEELVRTDALTGINNRRGLELFLRACRTSGRRPPQGLLLLDCDEFKQINDVYGHLAGDRVLQAVASALHSIATPRDVAARLGGDEFCLMVGETDRCGLQDRADFLLGAMRGLISRQGSVPRACAVSIGAALLMPSDDWNRWYSLADAALYAAKQAGGNQVVWHDSPAVSASSMNVLSGQAPQ